MMSYSSELSQLEIYERTVADFYKCLNILQSIYGAIPTLSTASCSEGESANVICRFLKNLAYLLDHTKDIGTTTAVAWEAYKDFIKFYVVLNGDTEKDVKTVLNLILKLIKAYITLDERQKWHGQTILLDQCTKYAFMKIEERAKRVRRAVKTYRYSPLRSQFGNIFNDDGFLEWLEQFERKQGLHDLSILCSLAYEARADPEMRQLSEMCETPGNTPEKNVLVATLREIQRNLVSLARHARAVKELCEDAPGLNTLLQAYHVERIPPLHTWTSLHHNTKQISIEPTNTALAPCTSAAIQLLEYYYRIGAEPAEKDRQVACSKLGCVGCEFFYHYNAAKSVDMECRGFSGSSFGGTPDKRRELMIKIVDGMRKKASHQLRDIVYHQLRDSVELPSLHADAGEAFVKSCQPDSQAWTVSSNDSEQAQSDNASDEFTLSPPSGLYAPWTPGTEVSTVDMTRSPKPPSRDVWQHYDVDDNGESASFDQESCADGKACAGQDQGSNMKIPTFDIMTLLREKLDAEMT